MNDKDITILLIVLFIVQFSIDLSTNECILRLKGKDLEKGLSNLFLHHLISIFANFGWLYKNKKILLLNIILILSIFIGWFINKGCFITQNFNVLCDYKHYEMFHDFFYYLNLKTIHPFYYFVVLIIMLNKIN
jgi:hypothetical protein